MHMTTIYQRGSKVNSIGKWGKNPFHARFPPHDKLRVISLLTIKTTASVQLIRFSTRPVFLFRLQLNVQEDTPWNSWVPRGSFKIRMTTNQLEFDTMPLLDCLNSNTLSYHQLGLSKYADPILSLFPGPPENISDQLRASNRFWVQISIYAFLPAGREESP